MNPLSRSVLVLGANGRFGRAAVDAFAAAGWQVLAHARRADAKPLPAGATPLSTPLEAAGALAAQAAGVSAVVYAINPLYTAWPRQALPLARLGMDVAQRLDATFMLPGNVYNFGAGMPPLLDEDTPQRPTTVKGRIRCALEAELAGRVEQGMRSVILRAGDFFGCGQGSWMDLVIVKSIATGKLVYPGPMDVPHAWAYLPDFARAFVAVAERGNCRDCERLHFAGHTFSGAQLLDAIGAAAEALGIRRAGGFKRGKMPWGLIRLGGALLPMWREVAEMSYLWQVPHALDGSRLAQRVGDLPGTPGATAIYQALADLGLSGVTGRPLAS